MEKKNRKKGEQSYARDVLRKFKAHKPAMIGLVFLLIMVVLVIILPWILPLDPYETSMDVMVAPNGTHLMGTDDAGRDVFARVIYGGRTSLYVGFASAFLSMLIGVPLGMIAGYFRGAAEIIIMRLADMFQSIPSMVLILVLISLVGPSVNSIIVIIGVLGWTGYARILFGSILSVREKEYVESARAIGAKDKRILLKYIFPNTFSPLLITFSFGVASAILQESALSFLGMGVQSPIASWGNIIQSAKSITMISRRIWMWLPAGICLFLTVLSINMVGDGLRDALDVKTEIV